MAPGNDLLPFEHESQDRAQKQNVNKLCAKRKLLQLRSSCLQGKGQDHDVDAKGRPPKHRKGECHKHSYVEHERKQTFKTEMYHHGRFKTSSTFPLLSGVPKWDASIAVSSSCQPECPIENPIFGRHTSGTRVPA